MGDKTHLLGQINLPLVIYLLCINYDQEWWNEMNDVLKMEL